MQALPGNTTSTGDYQTIVSEVAHEMQLPPTVFLDEKSLVRREHKRTSF